MCMTSTLTRGSRSIQARSSWPLPRKHTLPNDSRCHRRGSSAIKRPDDAPAQRSGPKYDNRSLRKPTRALRAAADQVGARGRRHPPQLGTDSERPQRSTQRPKKRDGSAGWRTTFPRPKSHFILRRNWNGPLRCAAKKLETSKSLTPFLPSTKCCAAPWQRAMHTKRSPWRRPVTVPR